MSPRDLPELVEEAYQQISDILTEREWGNAVEWDGPVRAILTKLAADAGRGGIVPQPQPEICICAAIRGVREGRIVRGHRHDDCIQTAVKMYIDPHRCEQGFITSHNRFVDRREGMRLQEAAGIESVNGYRGDTLFSEDLY